MATDGDTSFATICLHERYIHAGVAATMFKALAAENVNIKVIATSEIKISVLIDASYTELAVRALHTAYGLDSD